jgi:hypothetical protein
MRKGVLTMLCLSGIAILFASCEKEYLMGTGEGIEVRFSLNGTTYAGDEARSAGAEKGETVVVPLDDEYSLYATLKEEDAPSLRAATIPVNTRVMIVAYQTGTVRGYAEYKVVNTNGDIEPVSAGLVVPSPGNYNFAAYSISSTSSVPAYAATITVSGDNDLLYGWVSAPVSASGSNITIPMAHKFSLVTMEVSTVYIVSDVSAYVSGNKANLRVSDGFFNSAGSSENQAFTWTEASGPSDPRTVYAPGNPVVVTISSMKLGDRLMGIPITAKFSTYLEAGKRYKLTVGSFKTVVWAGSNIYWNSGGQYLTFDGPGASLNDQRKQGVFIKWGSLVGISPAEVLWADGGYSSSVPVYIPPTGSGSWSTTNIYSNWDDIPYVSQSDIGYYATGNDFVSYLIQWSGSGYWNQKKGDICDYLSSNGYGPDGNAYRMPTTFEMEFGGGTWTETGAYGYDYSTGGDDGTRVMSSYMSHSSGLAFPASGSMSSGGIYFDSSMDTYLWGGSLSTYSISDRVFLTRQNYYWMSYPIMTWTIGSGFHEESMPVRCVKAN